MIYIFRKEMKKWHTVLWIVFVSMAFSGVSFVIFRQKHISEISLAKVNGESVYFDQFRQALADINARINSLRPLAQAYGMSEDLFLSTFLGASRPEELALDVCIKQKLMDRMKNRFSISLDETWFRNELIKTLPQLADGQGRINMEMYQRYLERLSVTPVEYENRRREDFKREVVQQLIDGADYVPSFVVKDIYASEYLEKSFSVVRLPLSIFLSEVQQTPIDEAEVAQYYQDHKESYRVGEKRKAVYWTLVPSEYTKKIEIDAVTIKDFYEKHKSTLFRIAPRIKVRRILIPLSQDKAFDRAKEIHQKIVQNPDDFAALAKQHSQDHKTAKMGGVVDFFSKGTYDADFEKFAFRLKSEGEVSSVIKTKQGYEIIQLIDRIPASEKPFDSVKDDIARTLKAKRSLAAVRSDLEILMRSSRENENALDQFIQQHGLKSKDTDWISEKNLSNSGLDGELAKRLFSRNKQHSGFGYFVHVDDYIIYKLVDAEKSYIPKLADIKEAVIKDFYENKAGHAARNTLKQLRADIFSKKTTLEEVADRYKTKKITTKKVKKGAKISDLSQDGALTDKLFALTDPQQVLEYHFKDIFYLAEIHEIDSLNMNDLQQEQGKIIKQEKFKSKSRLQSAFIASLHRNAKIDIDQKMLQGNNTDLKE